MYRESSTGMFQLEAGSVRTPHPASDELYRAHSRRGVASEQALLALTRCKDGGFQRCETRIDPLKYTITLSLESNSMASIQRIYSSMQRIHQISENPEYIFDCLEHYEKILSLCTDISIDPHINTEGFLHKSSLIAENLPDPLKKILQQFHKNSNKEGLLLLKNLAAESHLPVTTKDHHKSSYISESCLAVIGARLGHLVGYTQEKNGSLFHDIVPLQSEENEQSSMGSLVQLELHTERCFHPFLPDYLLLYSLRPDPGHKGFTTHAGIRQILSLLSQKHIETLFQPVFRTGIDYSFGNKKTNKADGPVMSVLYGNKSDPFIRYDLDLMTGLSNKAELALQALREIAIEIMDRIYLEAGSLLIMDNKRCVHGRGEFTPRYDGNDRWLQRSYVLTDLGPSSCDRIDGSRVITTSFYTN